MLIDMKRAVRILTIGVLVAVFFAASCSDNQAVIASDTGETLRAKAAVKDEDALWTREVEKERLVRTIETNEVLSSSVKLSPESLIASLSSSETVYPCIQGFASLDTTLMSSELKSALDAFVSALSRNESADASFAPENLFSYVFFLSDLKSGWKTHFALDFPDAQTPLFTSSLYGSPFIDEAGAEVPVRFGFSGGFIDVLLYFEKDGETYTISNIEIRKWERVNGK
ncbi:hypothetical protein [Treponema sp. Marseille-Q4523]|uniref:hypothetical protein n=1 Tax=Treponema TaxID=157 RepID=UPI0019612C2F|nr:hypothetical protein [Treponema sp. Marseille-Q4523]MBM7022347.1 hypothetical protein [Treponema sp. Marseille-Q4523]